MAKRKTKRTTSRRSSVTKAMPTLSNAYGKRPLWYWVGMYVVIGGLIYALIYYFVLAKTNYSYTNPAGPTNYYNYK